MGPLRRQAAALFNLTAVSDDWPVAADWLAEHGETDVLMLSAMRTRGGGRPQTPFSAPVAPAGRELMSVTGHGNASTGRWGSGGGSRHGRGTGCGCGTGWGRGTSGGTALGYLRFVPVALGSDGCGFGDGCGQATGAAPATAERGDEAAWDDLFA